MKSAAFKTRAIVLLTVFCAVLTVFVLRLMQMQIVQGKEYAAQTQKGIERVQKVEAARGPITDRYGRPFAVNRIGYDIVLDRAFLPDGKENEAILHLVEIMEEAGEDWEDSLPISWETPFTFMEDKKAEVAQLKRYVQVNEYADAESVMHWLRDNFGLEGYDDRETRILAGVRYEMNLRGFSYSTPYVFARDVSIETVTKIEERSFELPGIDVQPSAQREYPVGTIAPHLIGLTGPIFPDELEALGESYALDDVVGRSGLEKAMEAELRGTEGERNLFINSDGEVVDVIETKAPVPGHVVFTTLDQKLQKIAQDSLEAQILHLQEVAPEGKGREAFSGAAVAVDVKTGEVLVAATYPSYDLSTYNQDYSELVSDNVGSPLFNRALQGTYTPGSIFKPTVALAGLAEGVITGDSTYYCGKVYTRFLPSYPASCLGHHGDINVVRALQESCNIFFYETGWNTGIDKVAKYAAALGLGEETGLELPNAKGVVSSPAYSASKGQDWWPGDVIQASIGQKDNKFSPLQLANYAATLANRGKRMDLTLIKSIKTFDYSETLYEHKPEVAYQLDVPPSTFDPIFEGMVACAQIGSASYSAAVNMSYNGQTFGPSYPITVAAKTGTPETSQHPNSTFITFAPAEDPQIAIAVVIEKGWHGYTGIPVARDIYDAYFGGQLGEDPIQGSAQLLP